MLPAAEAQRASSVPLPTSVTGTSSLKVYSERPENP